MRFISFLKLFNLDFRLATFTENIFRLISFFLFFPLLVILCFVVLLFCCFYFILLVCDFLYLVLVILQELCILGEIQMLKTTTIVPAPLLEVVRPLCLLLAPGLLPLVSGLLPLTPGQEIAPWTPSTGLRKVHLCFLWCHNSSEFVTKKACKSFEAPSLLKIFAHSLFFCKSVLIILVCCSVVVAYVVLIFKHFLTLVALQVFMLSLIMLVEVSLYNEILFTFCAHVSGTLLLPCTRLVSYRQP